MFQSPKRWVHCPAVLSQVTHGAPPRTGDAPGPAPRPRCCLARPPWLMVGVAPTFFFHVVTLAFSSDPLLNLPTPFKSLFVCLLWVWGGDYFFSLVGRCGIPGRQDEIPGREGLRSTAASSRPPSSAWALSRPPCPASTEAPGPPVPTAAARGRC